MTNSETISKNGWNRTDSYEIKLGVLRYDDSSFLSVPMELRERHLLPETEKGTIWSFGDEIAILIESNRDKIRLQVETNKFGFREPEETGFRGRNKGLISILSVVDLLPSRETLSGIVNVLETSDESYYPDEGKITFDDARKYVRRFDEKYSDRRSRVKARDICRKMDIEKEKHNLHRIGKALDERYSVEPGKKTKQYKIQ